MSKVTIDCTENKLLSIEEMQVYLGLQLYQIEQFDLLYRYIDMLSETIGDKEYFSRFTTFLLWFMKNSSDSFNNYKHDSKRYDKWLKYLSDWYSTGEQKEIKNSEAEIEFLTEFDVKYSINQN